VIWGVHWYFGERWWLWDRTLRGRRRPLPERAVDRVRQEALIAALDFYTGGYLSRRLARQPDVAPTTK
jgi:hypothetical protein